MPRVHLTRRALDHIDDIERYSTERWGRRVAAEYLEGLNTALQRLERRPDLLRDLSDGSLVLKFYGVQRHVLVAAVVGERVYILAVWHGSMDLLRRAAVLQPQLVMECEVLHARLAESKSE
jgi:plasmid stabilization system protein ParE